MALIACSGSMSRSANSSGSFSLPMRLRLSSSYLRAGCDFSHPTSRDPRDKFLGVDLESPLPRCKHAHARRNDLQVPVVAGAILRRCHTHNLGETRAE